MTAHSVLADNETGARFYDRLRERIHSYVGKGRVTEKIADFLLLAPDVFMLLWRLTNDPRVSGKDKVLLGTGVAYYIFPFDIVPEAILGPIGYLDDLVFGVYVLNRMLSDTDPQILREHWSGHEDILASIQKVLTAVDNLLAGDVISKLKKMAD
ncbi:MAG TPA: DUF1232 domain-containing protein [Thermoanaerobaculia bacterium]|jgi:uncharacterized membrane protein YkvA (DUF1232 family)|nr:DUF1232 domain-containing protein [Thermoanaerobaculia bacterium]